MRQVLAVAAGAVAGFVLGAFLGAQYYIQFGPPDGQFGYESEGLTEAVTGGLAGAAVGATACVLLLRRSRRGSR